MRGENVGRRVPSDRSEGTSPRARGKPPKHVGCVRHRREHPRVRGENRVWVRFFPARGGTSPRARGKRVTLSGSGLDLRNIPACAGKTFRVFLRVFVGREHPRVRGENKCRGCLRLGLGGTSPRARGKHRTEGYGNAPFRNIPACAGKTLCYYVVWYATGEHPRVRGENP